MYQEACAWHAGSEVCLETGQVPPPLLLNRFVLFCFVVLLVGFVCFDLFVWFVWFFCFMVGLFCFVSCLGLLVTNYRIPHGIYFLLVVVQLTISYFYMRVDTVECSSKAWAESRSEFGSYFDSQVSSWRLTSCRKCSLDAPRPPPRESQHRHRHTDAPLPLHPTTTNGSLPARPLPPSLRRKRPMR